MKHTLPSLLTAAVFAALSGSSAYAAVINGTWSNTGTDWNTTTSWNSNTPPTPGGTATFTGAEVTNPNISASVSVGELWFTANGTGYTISASPGQTLTLTNISTGSTGAINATNTTGTNTISAPIVLGGAANSTEEFTQASGGTLAITGTISDNGNNVGLETSGSGGVFVLSGLNTYTGTSTISGTGNITEVTSIGNAGVSGNLGAGSAIVLIKGQLDYLGTGESTNRTIDLSTGGVITNGGTGTLVLTGTVTTIAAGAQTLTLNGTTAAANRITGNISDGTGTLGLIINTGTWNVSGTNSYSGSSSITAGATLGIGSSTALGNGVWAFKSGATIDNTSGSALTLTTAGTATWVSTALTFVGSNSLNMGTESIVISGSSLVVTVDTGSNTGTLTVAGPIGDAGSGVGFTKAGPGVMILSGTNTYGGPTGVSAGTLQISGGGTLGTSTATLSVTGGTLDLGGTNQTTGTATFNGGTTQSGTLTSAGYASSLTTGTATVTATLAGSGALTKSGAGTLQVSGPNTYTGSTTLSAGTINFNSSTALGTGTLTIGGGTLDNTSGGAISSSSNSAIIQSANFAFSTAAGTANNSLTFTGAVSSTRSNVITLNGTGSITFGVFTNNIAGNNTLSVNNGSGTGATSALNLGGYVLSGTASTARNDAINGTGNVNITGTVSDVVSGTAASSLTYSGTGTLGLTGLNTYTGATTITQGTVIVNSLANIGTASSLGAASATTGTIALGGTAPATLVYTGTGSTSNRVINMAGGAGNGVTLDDSGTGTLEFTSSLAVATGTKTLTLQGSTAGIGQIDGVIADGASAKTLLTKQGSGQWTLTGSNTYTGATTVSAGTLAIASTGSLSTSSAVSVNGGTLYVAGKVGGTVAVANGATLSGNGGKVGALTLAAGGIINTEDGTIGTLNGTTLALTTGGSNAVLDLDLGSSNTADLLTFSGAATMSNNFTVNVNGISAGTGTYTIATAASGLVAADFTAGTLGGSLAGSGDTMTFVMSGSSVQLVLTGSVSSVNYYFKGTNSGTFTDPGNYNTLATGGSQQATALSSTSNVFLDATSPSNTPPTLNNSASINSLTFLTGGESLAGTGTLTVAATGTAGITDSVGNASTVETVAPSVVLGSSQSWVATSNSTLNVTGNISGAQSLALTGAGKFKLGGANTFQGLTVGTGSDTPTVLLTNGTNGSATGTTTLAVKAGATLGGTGTSAGTTFNIAGTGTATGSRAQILAGLNSVTDTSVGTSLKLTAATGTISNANLTFNISATSPGSSSQLNVGTTAVTFGAGVQSTTLSLNVQGVAFIAANTAYVLIAGSDLSQTSAATSQYSGLTFGTSTGSLATGLITPILNSGNGGSGNLALSLSGSAAGFYGASSYLFLYQDSTGADNIEVEVVPEPGTWALMIGGLAVLVFWQRRKSRQ